MKVEALDNVSIINISSCTQQQLQVEPESEYAKLISVRANFTKKSLNFTQPFLIFMGLWPGKLFPTSPQLIYPKCINFGQGFMP